MDILLDPISHDVVFENGTTLVTGEARLDAAQRLKIKLQTFLGEWFLNTEQGVDYFNRVFRKGVTKASIDATIQQQILEEPDIERIITYTSSIENRAYSASFRCQLVDGTTTSIVDLTIGA